MAVLGGTVPSLPPIYRVHPSWFGILKKLPGICPGAFWRFMAMAHELLSDDPKDLKKIEFALMRRVDDVEKNGGVLRTELELVRAKLKTFPKERMESAIDEIRRDNEATTGKH